MNYYDDRIEELNKRLLYVQSTATIDRKSEELANKIYEEIQELKQKKEELKYQSYIKEDYDNKVIAKVFINRYGLDDSTTHKQWKKIRQYTPAASNHNRQNIIYRNFIVNNENLEIFIWANYEDSENTYKIPIKTLFVDKKLRAYFYKEAIEDRENCHWKFVDNNVLIEESIVLDELDVLIDNLKNSDYVLNKEFNDKILNLNSILTEELNLIKNHAPYRLCDK